MSLFHFRSRLLYRGFLSGSVFIDYSVEMGHTHALLCPAHGKLLQLYSTNDLFSPTGSRYR